VRTGIAVGVKLEASENSSDSRLFHVGLARMSLARRQDLVSNCFIKRYSRNRATSLHSSMPGMKRSSLSFWWWWLARWLECHAGPCAHGSRNHLKSATLPQSQKNSAVLRGEYNAVDRSHKLWQAEGFEVSKNATSPSSNKRHWRGGHRATLNLLPERRIQEHW